MAELDLELVALELVPGGLELVPVALVLAPAALELVAELQGIMVSALEEQVHLLLPAHSPFSLSSRQPLLRGSSALDRHPRERVSWSITSRNSTATGSLSPSFNNDKPPRVVSSNVQQDSRNSQDNNSRDNNSQANSRDNRGLLADRILGSIKGRADGFFLRFK